MTTKECIKCVKEFPIENFRVTKKYKETIYRHSTCRDCDRGHGRGFAGKINDDEKKALMAADWRKPLIDIRNECGLKMSSQAWYRYNRNGDVQNWRTQNEIKTLDSSESL